MSTHVIEGDTGSGKSYIAVNGFIADYLRGSRRFIYTNLPLNRDEFISSLTPNVAKQSDYDARLLLVEERMAPVGDEIWLAWIRGTLGPCKGERPPVEYEDLISQEVWEQWQREVRDQQSRGFVVLPDPHCVELVAEGRVRNTLKEFWWFVRPGSVVVVDESADLATANLGLGGAAVVAVRLVRRAGVWGVDDLAGALWDDARDQRRLSD